jgi:molybdenum cofactor cytidylyltransferase
MAMTSFRSLSEALDVRDRALVAFVGAGGKTSLMSRMAWELYEERRRVAMTTTTRIGVDDVRDFWNATKLGDFDDATIDEVLGRAVVVARVPFLYSDTLPDEKLKGIGPKDADRVFGQVDFLIVEADGGRKASFKIPRPHEPVLPQATTHLCIVVGSEIFDQPVTRNLIFDLDGISKIMTIREGEVCPTGLLRKLLLREDGYLRHAAPGRKIFLVVNKVDTAEKVEAVMPRADELFHPALDGIILTSSEPGHPIVSVDNSRDRIGAIVLAAGRSERFGGPKLCREVDGQPLVQRAVMSALESRADRVCLVLGCDAEKVKGCLDILPSHGNFMTIENKQWAEGIGRSIAEGIAAVSQWVEAAMIVLADMPHVDHALMDKVISAYKKSNARLCFPEAAGRRGHPVILRKEFFPQLATLSGDEGARKICEDNLEWARVVKLADETSQLDVDTPEDLIKAEL